MLFYECWLSFLEELRLVEGACMLGDGGLRQIKLLKFVSRDLQNLIWIIYCVNFICLDDNLIDWIALKIG